MAFLDQRLRLFVCQLGDTDVRFRVEDGGVDKQPDEWILATTGKIERFHQSLRKEFLANRSFTSLERALGNYI
jgi:hypothetical protein